MHPDFYMFMFVIGIILLITLGMIIASFYRSKSGQNVSPALPGFQLMPSHESYQIESIARSDKILKYFPQARGRFNYIHTGTVSTDGQGTYLGAIYYLGAEKTYMLRQLGQKVKNDLYVDCKNLGQMEGELAALGLSREDINTYFPEDFVLICTDSWAYVDTRRRYETEADLLLRIVEGLKKVLIKA